MKHAILKQALLGGAALLALGMGTAMAAPTGGNILLTGHDNDFHCGGGFGDLNACNALGVEAAYVRGTSTLPVLTIDNGSELTSALTSLGVSFVNVTTTTLTAADFDHSLYSAFAVASVTTCGGCDNPVGTGGILASFESSIASFLNAGGGILGLTAASDDAGFAYVPNAASGLPISDSSGFVTTADASKIPGFFAVNGDETHNIFTSFDSAYDVAETDGTGGAAVTLFLSNGSILCTGTSCTVHGGGGVPEPASIALLGTGLFGLGFALRRRNRNKAK